MADQPTLHDMMLHLNAIIAGEYNMDVLCAALRVKPGQWMPLRQMSEEEFAQFSDLLATFSEHPYVYESRHVAGMSEVRTRVLKRRVRAAPPAPIEDWEIDPSILRGSDFTA